MANGRSRVGRPVAENACLARLSEGPGRLPAEYVFHAVGPVYEDGEQGEPEHLASCYRKCLELAEERRVATISFPAISTGIYGYPLEDAARIAIREVKQHLERPDVKVQQERRDTTAER